MKLIDHPGEGKVGNLVVWVAASDVAVMAREPALDQFRFDVWSIRVAAPGFGWVDPPERGRKGGAVLV